MSDISGPAPPSRPGDSGPKAAERAAKPSAVNRQHEQTQQTPQHARDHNARENLDDGQSGLARDPAVSIAASAAHVKSGDQIHGTIARIDQEGRPILETEDRAYALKPDAGLRVTDAVDLSVSQSARDITAALKSINGRPPEKPITLSLVVIAIHHQPTDDKTDLAGNTGIPSAYSAPKETLSFTPTDTLRSDAETLSTLLARSDIAPQILSPTSPPSAAPGRTDSLGAGAPGGPVAGEPVGQPLSLDQIAFQTDGRAVILNVVDPSLAGILAGQTTSVLQVSPLDLQDVRALNLPATLLADSSARLTALDTVSGRYIVPQAVSPSVAGALLVVNDASSETVSSIRQSVQSGSAAPSGAAQAASSSAAAQIRQYDAILISSDQSQATVSVAFPAPTSTASGAALAPPLGSLPLTSVQITANRLSPQGPVADMRLGTAIGSIDISLPPDTRPRVGEPVLISDLQASSPRITETTVGVASTGTNATGTGPITTPGITSGLDLAAAGSWPAFGEAVTLFSPQGGATTAVAGNTSLEAGALETTDAMLLPPTAGQELAARSAQGGAKLTNSLLFFLSALGSKKPSAYLGTTAEQALRKSDPALLDRLLRDISGLFAASAERPPGEWRPFTLPFEIRDGAVSLFTLLVRDSLEEDSSAGKDGTNDRPSIKATDFILQVDFSILGPVQLLGRIDDKMFDLTIANEGGFSSPLRTDIQALFTGALAANGYGGGLTFIDGQLPEDILSLMAENATGSGL